MMTEVKVKAGHRLHPQKLNKQNLMTGKKRIA